MKIINIEVPEKGFVVVDCKSGNAVAKMNYFPRKGRSLMTYCSDGIYFMPLMEGEIIGTPKLFERLIEKARSSS